MAVDLGRQRTGLAFSPDGRVVFPAGRLDSANEDELLEKLIKKIETKKTARVIFGLPLDQQGQPTKQSQWVKKMASRFHQKTQIAVDFKDEYLTTWQARQNRGKDRQIDEEAARIILEEYIEAEHLNNE